MDRNGSHPKQRVLVSDRIRKACENAIKLYAAFHSKFVRACSIGPARPGSISVRTHPDPGVQMQSERFIIVIIIIPLIPATLGTVNVSIVSLLAVCFAVEIE